jgi:hypothetical protein
MTPEIRNNPLLDNGSLTSVSAATDKLLEMELTRVSAAMGKHPGTWTVRNGDVYSVRPWVIKGGHIIVWIGSDSVVNEKSCVILRESFVEVTDSKIRTKSSQYKRPVVQEGIERVLGSHQLWAVVCMYKGWATKISPCTATFEDLFCCSKWL